MTLESKPELIVASLATVPGREEECRKAHDSLARQVDIVSVQDEAHNGRADDARKFLGQPPSGYVLTCDDDLIYPPDYAQFMIEYLEKFRKVVGPCVVSLMGRYMRRKVNSYYRDKGGYIKYDWRTADNLFNFVTFPGTGVMIYHTDDIRFSMEDFPHENMADIQVGIKCERDGVRVIRMPPPRKNWITYQPVPDTIWDRHKDDDELQTRLANTLVKETP